MAHSVPLRLRLSVFRSFCLCKMHEMGIKVCTVKKLCGKTKFVWMQRKSDFDKADLSVKQLYDVGSSSLKQLRSGNKISGRNYDVLLR